MPSFKPANYNQIHRPCIIQSVLDLCSKGLILEAVKSLQLLSSKGLRLDTRSLSFLLKQCANYRLLKEGKWVHLHLNLTGRKRLGTLLSNHLIHMYSECGYYNGARKVFDKMPVRNLYSWNNMLSGYAKLRMMKPARSLFDQMPEKDVVTWNTMIIGYAHCENFNEAIKFYKELKMVNIGLNEFSFSGVLIVCAKTKDLQLAKQVHGQVFGSGLFSSLVLCSSIIDCYAKCGEMSNARKLFDEMPQRDVVSWTSLLSGYAKWGDMNSARELFNNMPVKNSVSYNALISGYARNGFGHEALELFVRMSGERVKPDQFTFSSVLCACASIPSIKNGKQIHGLLTKARFTPNTIVVSSLIDMYSKCGNVSLAQRVFNLTSDKTNTILWNTMISALAHHGHGEPAVALFSDMVKSKVKPDRITFVVILNACSHSGLVQNGLDIFNAMRGHGIEPDQEHYACLVDVLGRAGWFDEVVSQLKKMPVKPDSRVWKALLGICRIHGNLDLGIKAAEQLIELEPGSSGGYVLLSGMYAASGKWDLVAKVRKVMNERGVTKERGVSWLESGDKLHAFAVAGEPCGLKDEFESVLEVLAAEMEDENDQWFCDGG